MTGPELAGLVCARICHDLVSPVGAVVNGADLIAELRGADASDELAMVAQSAARAAAILKFHRLAFGAPGDTNANLTRAQLAERAGDVLAGPRVNLVFIAPEGPALPLPRAQLVCLMLLAARAMLGMNGALRVVLPAGDGLPVAVMAEGESAGATPDQRRWLSDGDGSELNSRQVEFALIGPAAAAAGARLELIEGPGQLALRAVPK